MIFPKKRKVNESCLFIFTQLPQRKPVVTKPYQVRFHETSFIYAQLYSLTTPPCGSPPISTKFEKNMELLVKLLEFCFVNY